MSVERKTATRTIVATVQPKQLTPEQHELGKTIAALGGSGDIGNQLSSIVGIKKPNRLCLNKEDFTVELIAEYLQQWAKEKCPMLDKNMRERILEDLNQEGDPEPSCTVDITIFNEFLSHEDFVDIIAIMWSYFDHIVEAWTQLSLMTKTKLLVSLTSAMSVAFFSRLSSTNKFWFSQMLDDKTVFVGQLNLTYKNIESEFERVAKIEQAQRNQLQREVAAQPQPQQEPVMEIHQQQEALQQQTHQVAVEQQNQQFLSQQAQELHNQLQRDVAAQTQPQPQPQQESTTMTTPATNTTTAQPDIGEYAELFKIAAETEKRISEIKATHVAFEKKTEERFGGLESRIAALEKKTSTTTETTKVVISSGSSKDPYVNETVDQVATIVGYGVAGGAVAYAGYRIFKMLSGDDA